MHHNSPQNLAEGEVIDALDYYVASATADAGLKNSTLNAPGGKVMVGYVLCLYYAAVRSETGLPSVMLPQRGGFPKRLQSNTCPLRFLSLFNRWAAAVPYIQQLSRQCMCDLESAICKQPLTSPDLGPYTPSPYQPAAQYSLSPEVDRILNTLLALARDIYGCRNSRSEQQHQTHHMPGVMISTTPSWGLPQHTAQTFGHTGFSPVARPPISPVQLGPFFGHIQSSSPPPLSSQPLPSPTSSSSYSPVSEMLPPGSTNSQGQFIGGFVGPAGRPLHLNESGSFMVFPSANPYNTSGLPDVNEFTPMNTPAAMRSQASNQHGSITSTEASGRIIGAYTPASEIIAELCSHGCQDLTSSLNRSTISLRPVSQGGFGEVYLAQLLDGTVVALKSIVVHEDYDEPKQHKHAARELHTWSKCKHLNIAPLLGLAEFNDRIAMVSRWMSKGNLRKYVKDNPSADRFGLCIHVAKGLEYLHSVGIVHGDLKGANVLISDDEIPVLIDFGNATMSDCTVQFTQTATKQNLTPRWTAPELLYNEKPSPASDVYALGMTILEAFTGEAPYFGVRDSAIMFTIGQLRKLPDRPIKNIPENQPWGDMLWELLVACWWSVPEERPTATDVCQHLHKISDECQRC